MPFSMLSASQLKQAWGSRAPWAFSGFLLVDPDLCFFGRIGQKLRGSLALDRPDAYFSPGELIRPCSKH